MQGGYQRQSVDVGCGCLGLSACEKTRREQGDWLRGGGLLGGLGREVCRGKERATNQQGRQS